MTAQSDYLNEISFTKLKSLYECPLSWYKKYVLNKEPENDIAEEFKVGREFHFLIERIFEGHGLKREYTEDLAKINPELADTVEELALTADEVLIEKKIEKEINGTIVKGVPDVVLIFEDYIEIIDIKPLLLWKSMKFENLDKFTQIQLMFYAWLLSENYPEHAIIVSVLSYISPIPYLRWMASKENIEKFQRALLKEIDYANKTFVDYLEHGFEARPGAWCAFCRYKMSCPSEYKIDDFQSVANELRKLEEKVEELRKIVKDYTRQTGKPLRVGNYEYGWFDTIRTEVDNIRLLNYMIDNGIDFKQFFKANIQAIIQLAKQNEEIANFVFQDVVWQFRGKKIKEKEEN